MRNLWDLGTSVACGTCETCDTCRSCRTCETCDTSGTCETCDTRGTCNTRGTWGISVACGACGSCGTRGTCKTCGTGGTRDTCGTCGTTWTCGTCRTCQGGRPCSSDVWKLSPLIFQHAMFRRLARAASTRNAPRASLRRAHAIARLAHAETGALRANSTMSNPRATIVG